MDEPTELAPTGQALCRTPLDYSEPPQERWISGCTVCDRVLPGMPRPQGGRSIQNWLLPLVLVVVMILMWRAIG